jgi:CO/xanthine dehydrogenase FAD-binding subunit
VETALIGRPVDGSLANAVRSAPVTELSPIDDVRGSTAYRLEAAREIAARAVCLAAGLTPESMAA